MGTLKPRYMAIEQAQAAIGQPFKVTALRGGLLGEFDTIRRVDPDGTITGDWTQAYCEDCRFRGDQPEHLRKVKD